MGVRIVRDGRENCIQAASLAQEYRAAQGLSDYKIDARRQLPAR